MIVKIKENCLRLCSSIILKLKTVLSSITRKGFSIIIVAIEVLLIICVALISQKKYTSTVKQDKLFKDLSVITVNKNLQSKTSIDADKCKQLYYKNKDVLVLVNRDNELPKNYNLSLKPLLNGREQVSTLLYDDLVDMLKYAKDLGYSFWIASGYRSFDDQQNLINNQMNSYISEGKNKDEAEYEIKKTLAMPGHSEHHTGLAIDFLSSDNLNMDISQENSAGNKWLRDNSYRYGFILRYPKGKENITFINYEPWHFRYVGKDVAYFMYENNLTFEEFYNYVQK